MREIHEADGGEDDISSKEVVTAAGQYVDSSNSETAVDFSLAEMAELLSLRVSEKARCRNTPNPEIPRVQVQLISELAPILPGVRLGARPPKHAGDAGRTCRSCEVSASLSGPR